MLDIDSYCQVFYGDRKRLGKKVSNSHTSILSVQTSLLCKKNNSTFVAKKQQVAAKQHLVNNNHLQLQTRIIYI